MGWIVIKAWEEKGFRIPPPYERIQKRLLAPDKNEVKELTLSQTIIASNSGTDYHKHDRAELMYIVTGRGKTLIEGHEYELQPDVVLWVPGGIKHQLRNSSDETMKVVTIFVPAYTAEYLNQRALAAAKKATETE